LQGTVYYRNSEVYTLNGQASGFGACQQPAHDPAQLCRAPGPGEEPLRQFGGPAFNVRVDAENRYYGIYGSDTVSLTPDLSANLAARLNLAAVQLTDLFGTSLTGSNEYSHFNPSAELTYQVNDALNLYGNYSVSNRIPTPAELSCANPALPCRFPLGFVSDPTLQQVVAQTVELGARASGAARRRRPPVARLVGRRLCLAQPEQHHLRQFRPASRRGLFCQCRDDPAPWR
jgi:outer membrane receptor protein involved in Fe transport